MRAVQWTVRNVGEEGEGRIIQWLVRPVRGQLGETLDEVRQEVGGLRATEERLKQRGPLKREA